jgi:hypothetical protein
MVSSNVSPNAACADRFACHAEVMDEPLFADLNKPSGGEIWLTTSGTLRDLARFGIALYEGMRLDFWDYEDDANGSRTTYCSLESCLGHRAFPLGGTDRSADDAK